MANTVTSQTLVDGSQRTVLKWYFASDGASGELTNQVIFDASAVSPATANCVIERIRGYQIGFTSLISFDATADVPVMALPTDDSFDYDFRSGGVPYNGIPNNGAAGRTGDILFSTTGFTAAGDIGWIEITVRKI